MSTSNVIGFAENAPLRTNEDGLAYIANLRREVDRFSVALPGVEGKCPSPEFVAEVRRTCDEVEADIRKKMENI